MKVTIIGTGLMGGSMGLALRAADPSIEVIGVDSESTLEAARSRDAISHGATDLRVAVSDADVILICTPPEPSLSILEQIRGHVKPGTVISDMSSVKTPIVDLASRLFGDDVLFVGGHPMTGSERNGIRHANGVLFENATYVLCCDEKHKQQLPEAYVRLTTLISLSGARIIQMSAQKHDRIAARVSHLPQLLSVLLMNLASNSRAQDPELLLLAAGGFRDMTRIASSPYPMWQDILMENQREVVKALEELESQLTTLKNRIASSDFEFVGQCFHEAEQTRDFIPIDRKGFLKPLADVFVFTSDRPGALVDITTSLFKADLNIKDIELLRIREGTGGTFRLGFHTAVEANRAVEVLSGTGISAYRL